MDKKLKIEVLSQGMYSTIQDLGRMGQQEKGIPVGGAADRSSAAKANLLVDNPTETPVIEMTYLGASLRFYAAAQIAITGGDLSPTLDNEPIKMYETIDVPKNGILSFGKVKHGCRAYVAIRGHWLLEPVLGSCSPIPFMDEISDPFILKKNDIIEIELYEPMETTSMPLNYRPFYENNIRIKVKQGPEFNQFTKEQLTAFFSNTFEIGLNASRMGVKLKPTIPMHSHQNEMISSGIVVGTIQISHDGSPIILLADAQTTGGYPRIANVIDTSIDRLGQFKPGDKVGFVLVK